MQPDALQLMANTERVPDILSGTKLIIFLTGPCERLIRVTLTDPKTRVSPRAAAIALH